MPSTHKKVIVRKMDRDSVSGYVSPTQFINEGKLELLNTTGTVVAMELREIKGVYFVREFGDSESLTRKTFTSRPRSEGLWVRLRFKDNEILEGLTHTERRIVKRPLLCHLLENCVRNCLMKGAVFDGVRLRLHRVAYVTGISGMHRQRE